VARSSLEVRKRKQVLDENARSWLTSVVDRGLRVDKLIIHCTESNTELLDIQFGPYMEAVSFNCQELGGRISLNLEQFKLNRPLGLQRIEAQGSERDFSVFSIPAKVHYYAEAKVHRNGTSSWAVSSLVVPTILSEYSTITVTEGLGRDLCVNAAHVDSLILDGFKWKYGASDLRSLSFEV